MATIIGYLPACPNISNQSAEPVRQQTIRLVSHPAGALVACKACLLHGSLSPAAVLTTLDPAPADGVSSPACSFCGPAPHDSPPQRRVSQDAVEMRWDRGNHCVTRLVVEATHHDNNHWSRHRPNGGDLPSTMAVRQTVWGRTGLTPAPSRGAGFARGPAKRPAAESA
jgi:hypothetical protein